MSESVPRPALRTLRAQQRELIDHRETSVTDLECSLRPGFDTLRDLIRWYQAATVRTFGAIGQVWKPTRLVSDRALLQACIVSGRRRQWAKSDVLDLEAATAHRRVLEENAVSPANHAAFNQLRRMAGEYIGEDDAIDTADVHPDRQDIAMRPAFSRKDVEQKRALEQLWNGFGHEDALRDWLQDLLEPSNGALDEDFVARIMRDSVAVSLLVRGRSDPALAQPWREEFAVTVLLPAFLKGIRRMDAGELAKQTRDKLEAAQG